MKKMTTALALIASLFTINSYAATFDFVGYADAHLTDQNGTTFSEGSYDPFIAKEGGITLTATGTSGLSKAFAYLDEHNAGLGLCKSNLTSCGSDDNVGDGETLTLNFDTKVQLGKTTFSNSGHLDNYGGFIQLFVDGNFATDLYLSASLDLSAFSGKEFSFVNLKGDVGKDDFYISTISVSAVPVPAAAFLFAPALMGFVGLRRQAAKKA